MVSVAALGLPGQSSLVVAKAVWPKEPEMLIVWPFTEKVFWPLD